jgi:hypothetical protein
MRTLFTFFECNFSSRICNYLQINCQGHGNMPLQPILDEARRSFGHPFFMEVVITACWHIWLIRNAKIFNHERPTFRRWKAGFTQDMYLLQHRIKKRHRVSFPVSLVGQPSIIFLWLLFILFI